MMMCYQLGQHRKQLPYYTGLVTALFNQRVGDVVPLYAVDDAACLKLTKLCRYDGSPRSKPRGKDRSPEDQGHTCPK